MSGKFEVAKFHGIDVAIFDSHWFANRIIKTGGNAMMCCQIEQTAYDTFPCGTIYFTVVLSCVAAMQPYSDFMAIHKRNINKGSFLEILFTVELSDKPKFRLEAARRMLAAEPIRYCVPLGI